MLVFKAKMHHIQSLQRSLRSPSWIKGGLLLREWEGKSGEEGGKEREGKGGDRAPKLLLN